MVGGILGAGEQVILSCLAMGLVDVFVYSITGLNPIDTLITMSDGSTKRLDEIEIGDCDVDKGYLDFEPVMKQNGLNGY